MNSSKRSQIRPAVPDTTRNLVLGRQFHKCNNRPDGPRLRNLGNYKCPMWSRAENPGSFDESGYHLDHIKPWAQTHDSGEAQLQALCVACHAVKTRADNLETREKKLSEARVGDIKVSDAGRAKGASTRGQGKPAAHGGSKQSSGSVRLDSTSRGRVAKMTPERRPVLDRAPPIENMSPSGMAAFSTIGACLPVPAPGLVPKTRPRVALTSEPAPTQASLPVQFSPPSRAHTCPKCNKAFQFPNLLRRHLARKTPCEPIIEPDLSKGEFACEHCGRSFTNAQAASRHTRLRCKVANGDHEAKQSPDRTIQEQVAILQTQVVAQTAILQTQVVAQTATLAEMADMLRQLASRGSDCLSQETPFGGQFGPTPGPAPARTGEHFARAETVALSPAYQPLEIEESLVANTEALARPVSARPDEAMRELQGVAEDGLPSDFGGRTAQIVRDARDKSIN
jgi:hypothetical protein